MNKIPEPRSINDIMADLLQVAIDSQWSDETNVECHCHPRYVHCCSECDILESEGTHKFDCKRVLLINEVRGYLQVENDLAEARGENGVYIP
jgi:hypothetical protein